ncbi:MAG: DNA gyrase modulator, partial [Pseudomonadota bacterium]
MTMDSNLDLARQLMDLARRAGAAEADVLVVDGTSSSVGVADRALEEAERAEGQEAGLRVIAEIPGGGRGQASVASSDTRPEALAEMAERAVTMARAAPDDPYCGLAESAQLSALRDADGLDLADPEAPAPAETLEAL